MTEKQKYIGAFLDGYFHDKELDYNLLAESGIATDIPRVEVVYSLTLEYNPKVSRIM